MTARARSVGGAVIMLAIIPVFAGLLACMPVPIGDPERSRVDPEMSGVWVVESDGDIGPVALLRPYDKRTWLILWVEVSGAEGEEGEPVPMDTAADMIAALETDYFDPPTDITIFKAWTVKLRRQTFMTWEMIGGYDEEGVVLPEYWYVWKVEKTDENEFSLRMVNGEHDVFDEIEFSEGDDVSLDRARRAYERVLKKHMDNPELYVDDDEAWVFRRVPDEALDDAMSLFEEIIEFE